MNHLSGNLKILRKRKGWSQGDMAARYDVSRSTVSAYEIGSAEPNIDTLLKFSEDFGISIDRLIRQDLSAISEKKLSEIERGLDFDYSGKNLRILATTVTESNEDRIELVPVKAKAGYAAGYGDPDFLKELPNLHLPFLPRDKKHRAFQVNGDSMLPIPDKSYVVGAYLEDWNDIKPDEKYIIISKEDGIVLKCISGNWRKTGDFILSSTNPDYKPYNFPVQEVLEIWKLVLHISDRVLDSSPTDLGEVIRNIQSEIAQLSGKINNTKR
ncbi:MAG: helix-turn-helix domain-containing protein [Cryomorphaceae bacterium]|nr:helix-turn-helix domain-containing protein [Cryomorphaceae bacterium]